MLNYLLVFLFTRSDKTFFQSDRPRGEPSYINGMWQSCHWCCRKLDDMHEAPSQKNALNYQMPSMHLISQKKNCSILINHLGNWRRLRFANYRWLAYLLGTSLICWCSSLLRVGCRESAPFAALIWMVISSAYPSGMPIASCSTFCGNWWRCSVQCIRRSERLPGKNLIVEVVE